MWERCDLENFADNRPIVVFTSLVACETTAFKLKCVSFCARV